MEAIADALKTLAICAVIALCVWRCSAENMADRQRSHEIKLLQMKQEQCK